MPIPTFLMSVRLSRSCLDETLAANDLSDAQDLSYLAQILFPNNRGEESNAFKMLRLLKRVGVECIHRCSTSLLNSDDYIISKFTIKISA